MIDIFNPQISVVTKGLEGKLILIYGTNRTGKTLNAVKAEKPYVVGFERGLNAIPGIPYGPILKWRDWTDTVKQLTGPNMAKAKEIYKTIIIDTADAMGDLAAEYVCGVYNADSIGAGNRGYGLWKEYAAEINKHLRLLTNSGYTVIFIAHEGEREFSDVKGDKYSKIYPRGEKRVIDPICDLCDFICYAQIQPETADGKSVLSTLWLKGTHAYHAGSRFTEIVESIPEWNMEKLEKAITDAVVAESKKSKSNLVDYSTYEDAQKESARSNWDDKSFSEIVGLCIAKGQATIEKTGSPELYQSILLKELGNRDFKVSSATENQRAQVEQLLDALIANGY